MRSIHVRGLFSRRAASYIVFLIMSLAAWRCGANLYTIDDDLKFGRELDREIRNQPTAFPPLRNEVVRAYVQSIVDRLVETPEIRYRGTFAYRVMLLEDDEVVNAFASPGGYIYVYTGLLKFVDNEATLAGVMGHEIAHAEERHATQVLSAQVGVERFFKMTLGQDSTDAAQVIGGIATMISGMRYSKENEIEADTRSFGYLRATEYWPGAIKLFFHKILRAEAEGNSPLPEGWEQTHPLPQSRIQNIDRLLAQSGTPRPTAASLGTARYREMLRNLD